MEKSSDFSSKRSKSREQYFQDINFKFDPTQEGLLFTNFDCIRIQREMPPSMVSQLFTNVIKGKHLFDFQFPIKNYAPYTTTLMVICELRVLSIFIDKMILLNDPLERFKLLVTYGIANKHVMKGNEVPLLNHLGETCQLKVGDLMIYTECISTFPLTILIYGEAKNYYIQGYFLPSTDSGIFSGTHTNGTNITIILKDQFKTTYFTNYPSCKISGTGVGTRMVNYTGNQIVLDKTNHLYSKLMFNANRYHGFFNKLLSSTVERFDFVRGIITNKEELLKIESNDIFAEKEILAFIEAYWTEYVKIDGKTTWNFEDFDIPEFIISPNLIPSDENLRGDLIGIQSNILIKAQEEFNRLLIENEKDEELRKAFQKK